MQYPAIGIRANSKNKVGKGGAEWWIRWSRKASLRRHCWAKTGSGGCGLYRWPGSQISRCKGPVAGGAFRTQEGKRWQARLEECPACCAKLPWLYPLQSLMTGAGGEQLWWKWLTSTFSFLSLFLGVLIPPPSHCSHSLDQQPFLHKAKVPRRWILRVSASQSILVSPFQQFSRLTKIPICLTMWLEGQVSCSTKSTERSNRSQPLQ